MRNLDHIAVVGVTGYTGFELARILVRHPDVKTSTFYMRDTQGAKCLDELFPQLRGRGDAPLRTFSVDAIAGSKAGVAFLATPHDVSTELAPALVKRDYGWWICGRFDSIRVNVENWYKLPRPRNY
jgi:N-acetyl-gamma-glutamyl-phosphate reductase